MWSAAEVRAWRSVTKDICGPLIHDSLASRIGDSDDWESRNEARKNMRFATKVLVLGEYCIGW